MPQRPYVIVNMAMTADGKIDTVARRGARISGAADTARVDRLRASSDAIIVGGRTLLGEDPRLTVRDPTLVQERIDQGRPPQPAKVGVVSRIDELGGEHALPPDSRFLGEGGGRVIVHTTTSTGPDATTWLRSRGAEVVVHDGPRVDLTRMLDGLAGSGIEQLMVEGGGTLVAALMEADLVDELQLMVAPIVLGGETAPTPVGGIGRNQDEAIRLSLLEAFPNEDGDVLLRYRVSVDVIPVKPPDKRG